MSLPYNASLVRDLKRWTFCSQTVRACQQGILQRRNRWCGNATGIFPSPLREKVPEGRARGADAIRDHRSMVRRSSLVLPLNASEPSLSLRGEECQSFRVTQVAWPIATANTANRLNTAIITRCKLAAIFNSFETAAPLPSRHNSPLIQVNVFSDLPGWRRPPFRV